MAYKSHIKLWESEFGTIVSRSDKLQDMNNSQIKLEAHGIYKKDEEITTSFESSNDEDVINKGCLQEKLIKINGNLTFLKNGFNESTLQNNN